MKKTIFCLCVFYYISGVNAQLIRKNYLEMTSSEYTDFNTALGTLWNSGSTAINNHAWFSSNHFNHANDTTPGPAIHGAENFLPFHRFFILHWELLIRASSSSYEYLSLPYWDWRNDPICRNPGCFGGSSIMSATSAPNFWAFSFFPAANFASWGVARTTTFSVSNLSSLPDNNSYNSAMAVNPNSFSTLSGFIESGNHATVHAFMGTTNMPGVVNTFGTLSSPLDPGFFLHHAMVDKVWQDWEDQDNLRNSVFTNTPQAIPVYHTIHSWISNLDANSCWDSRHIPFTYATTIPVSDWDVWYAFNGKVILDGNNNNDFVVNGNGKIYRYTTNGSPVLGGNMYIGDVYRDASNNILPDNKGGFTVPAAVSAHFRAGGEINLLPGASFYADSTSLVTFSIITAPNGF